MDYKYVVRDLLSSEVPQAYTSIKTEQQAKETMMGVVIARTRKARDLLRDYVPVNWYNAPPVLDGKLFRFPWLTKILRNITNPSSRASSNSRSNYTFKFIQILIGIGKSPWTTPARALSPVDRSTWITSYNIWISHVCISGMKWLHKCLAEWPLCSMSLPGIHKER